MVGVDPGGAAGAPEEAAVEMPYDGIGEYGESAVDENGCVPGCCAVDENCCCVAGTD